LEKARAESSDRVASIDARASSSGLQTPQVLLRLTAHSPISIRSARRARLCSRSSSRRRATSVSGQTNVDPKGYLTDLNSLKVNSEAEIGDIKKAQLLLKSVVTTNPKHAPGWIAIARLEEVSGKIVQARRYIDQGCHNCPDAEDVWLEAARLHTPANAAALLARAVQHNPQSIRALAARRRARERAEQAQARAPQGARAHSEQRAPLEGRRAARAARRRARAARPRRRVRAAQRRALARAGAPRDVRECAQSAQRRAQAPAHRAVDLDQRRQARGGQRQRRHARHYRAARRQVARAERRRARARPVDRRGRGGREGRARCARRRRSCAPRLAPASTRRTASASGSTTARRSFRAARSSVRAPPTRTRSPRFRPRSRSGCASPSSRSATRRRPTSRACCSTLRCELAPTQRPPQTAAAATSEPIARAGERSVLDRLLETAVQQCPTAEVLWLMWAKDCAVRRDIDGARQVLQRAFAQNSNSEHIWLAAVTLERDNGEVARARALLARARERAGTERVWMKSALLERDQGKPEDERACARRGAAALSAGRQAVDDARAARRAARRRRGGATVLRSRPEEPGAIDSAVAVRGAPRGAPEQFCQGARDAGEGARAQPEDDMLWLEAVRVERAANQEKIAEALLSKALQECPTSGVLWAAAIQFAARAQRRARSVDALKRCDNDVHVVLAVGKLFWAERLLEKARTWLNRAVLLDGRKATRGRRCTGSRRSLATRRRARRWRSAAPRPSRTMASDGRRCRRIRRTLHLRTARFWNAWRRWWATRVRERGARGASRRTSEG
jgi:pre-mRNA-processing factor 6